MRFDYQIRYKVGLKIIKLEDIIRQSTNDYSILMFVYCYSCLSDNTTIFHTKFACPDMTNSFFGGLYIPQIILDNETKKIKEFECPDESFFRNLFSYIEKRAAVDTTSIVEQGNILIYPPIKLRTNK